MRVLVTGGNGFIGRHAVEHLVRQGHEVVIASRNGRSVVKGADAVAVDLLQDGAASRLIGDLRPEGLLHLAWETTHGVFWSAPDNLRWNVVTCELLDTFLEKGGVRGVFAGTCAEYGWNRLQANDLCVEKSTPLSPETYYGQQKLDAFWQVDEQVSKGASLAWGRVFFLYGADETPTRFVSHVMRKLLQNEVADMSSGTQIRDFMDVRDVGRGFADLFAANKVTGPVNVASGVPCSLRDVADEIARQLGSVDLLRFGALPDRDNEPKTLVADIRRLRDEVGFTPRHSLQQGIADMLSALKAEMQV
jgi:nucleoside-diphosphate-sugar epimerase